MGIAAMARLRPRRSAANGCSSCGPPCRRCLPQVPFPGALARPARLLLQAFPQVRWKPYTGLIALLACGATLAAATPVRYGGHELAALSCGVRQTLWIRHYAAELFVRAGEGAAALVDPSQPKLLRMRIVNAQFMPSEIPRRWRKALQPVLDAATMARVRAGYRALEGGDVVFIGYHAGSGVTLKLNGRLLAQVPGHGAIDALLQAWAADTPAQEKLRATIARNPC